MIGFEENEISRNANGGTELAKRRLATILNQDLLEDFQIVCSRIRDLDDTKIRIYWAHDLPEDPESSKFKDPKFRESFHKFVFISDWQYHRYQLVHGIPYDEKSIVLETAIDVEDTLEPFPSMADKCNEDVIRIVYTSTPQRGLHILVDAVEELAKKYPFVHLDVFSSFKIYGWDDVDKQFEPLYDRIRAHPNMTYHGFKPNAFVRSYLNRCHIFAYPSIWRETSCRAMIEAAAAGLVCVHPNFGALSETSGGMTRMYHGDFLNQDRHRQILIDSLVPVLDQFRNGAQKFYFAEDNYMDLVRQQQYFNSRFDIRKIAPRWERMLSDLKVNYPTAMSRAIPRQKLIYRTS